MCNSHFSNWYKVNPVVQWRKIMITVMGIAHTVGYFVVDAELPIEKLFNLIIIIVTLKISCQTHCC